MTDTATPKYKEMWRVKLSTRDEFDLDGVQFRELQNRMKVGDLGIVAMKDGGFKISHIVCWNLISRQIENQLTSPEKYPPQTPEERLRARKKIKEIRDLLTQGL